MTRSPRSASRVSLLSVLFAGLLIAAVPSVTTAQPSMPSEGRPPVVGAPVVVTQGEAVIRRPADRAFVTVTTETRSRDPREAQQQNAQIMTAVQLRLAAARVPKDAIRTLGYYLDQEADYVNGKRVPRGFVARNTIEVRLDELDRVGEIIDLVVEAGATAVGNVRFDLKDRSAVEREAIKQAVADALARAEAAAAGANRTIDRVQRIEEVGVRVPQPQPFAMPMRVGAPAPPPETPVTAAEIEVRAQVTLTAVLK